MNDVDICAVSYMSADIIDQSKLLIRAQDLHQGQMCILLELKEGLQCRESGSFGCDIHHCGEGGSFFKMQGNDMACVHIFRIISADAKRFVRKRCSSDFAGECRYILQVIGERISGTGRHAEARGFMVGAPVALLLGAGIGQLVFGSIRGGAAAYYFSNLIGDNAVITCAVFLTIGELAQMAGVALAGPVSERIGKRNTFIACLLFMALVSCVIWFLPITPAGTWGLIVCQVLICLGIGISAPLIWSMMADVADWSAWKNGTSSTGLIFSSSSMAQKFGGALGGFLLLQVLAWFGYDKSLAVQAPETLSAIRALMSWIPAIGSLLGALCLAFYPLTSDKMKQIQKELHADE